MSLLKLITSTPTEAQKLLDSIGYFDPQFQKPQYRYPTPKRVKTKNTFSQGLTNWRNRKPSKNRI